MTHAGRCVVFNMRDERPVWSPPAWVAARLREALPAGMQLVEVAAAVSGRGDGGGLSPEALDAVRGAEVYLGLGLPRDLLRAALAPPARLRWIHTGAAGVGSLLHPELLDSDVVLTNSAGVHGPPMAETVIGMLLHFARGLDLAVAAQARREWRADLFERADPQVRELDGATLGIIGYGGVGRDVADRARALGMRVLALRRTPAAQQDGPAQVLAGPDALDRVLAAADFLVLTVPSTSATRGLIGARELERMKPGAVLVNVARGDVVDEAALVRALEGGRLRGAALDVFTTEPLPADSRLWQLPNVLILPHVSATSPRYWEREAALILDNLERYAAGAPLRNTVDIRAGY